MASPCCSVAGKSQEVEVSSAAVCGVILLIVLIILAMVPWCLRLGPRHVLALATLVTAISGLVTALALLM